MKRPLFLILACSLAAAGCSGSGNSANSADNSAAASNAAAPAASAAPESGGQSMPIDLPVYPGAVKSTIMGNMNATKCGHKETVETYTTPDSVKTVVDWYDSHIPNGIHIDSGKAFGGGKTMTSIEIVNPDGSNAVGVTQPHLPAGVTVPGMKANAVFIGIGKYDPPFNSEELQTMQALFGNDPAAKKDAAAKMRAKCGPNSVPAGI
jgi:hypothetical protein